MSMKRNGRAIASAAVALLIFLVPAPGAAAYEKDKCHSDSAPDKSDEHERVHGDERKPAEENCDVDRVRNDKERERMARYIEEFVDRDTIVKSLELESGDIVDCVDVYRQPALRRAEMKGHKLMFEPSYEPKEDREAEGNEEDKGGVSKFDEDPSGRSELIEGRQLYGSNGELCPEKTVPIRRPTMEILKNFETLEDYFSKEPPHLVNGPNNLHQYAHAYRSVSNWGAQTALNVWSPYTERANEFSLSQMWVVRGSGSNLETVETGWQKYRDLYGDYRPRLFIYFTPDNYGSGGCYNLSCGAFVQVNNSVYIGGGFSNISQHPHPSTGLGDHSALAEGRHRGALVAQVRQHLGGLLSAVAVRFQRSARPGVGDRLRRRDHRPAARRQAHLHRHGERPFPGGRFRLCGLPEAHSLHHHQ